MYEKFVFVLLAVTLTCCQSELQGEAHRQVGTLNRYYLSSGDPDTTEYIHLANTEAAIERLDFMYGNQTVAIVIHGRESSALSEFGRTMVSSFFVSDPEVIVILVDWALTASKDYETVFHSASLVADDIIDLIVKLETASKIDRSLVHIVGFDVGAHIAGIVSRDPRARVQRVTGLSPAGEKWDPFSLRLRPTDANYVEVIHTDYSGRRALGIDENIGTVNIYANSGTTQPGCSNNQCNHNRAWQLFAANLDTGGHLVGLKCETLREMTRDQCTTPPAISLGTNDLFKYRSGMFRINTNRAYPF